MSALTLEAPTTREHAIELLTMMLTSLPKGQQVFAASLITQYHSKKKLSDKQWYWVERLVAKAQGIPDFTEGNTSHWRN